MEFITEQDCYDYLGIDYADDMVSRRVRALIDAMDSYLTGAIGRDYAIAVSPESLAKARELGLMLIGELYDDYKLQHMTVKMVGENHQDGERP